jgi:hypothetical protein
MNMASVSNEEIINIICKDGEVLPINISIARVSKTLENFFEISSDLTEPFPVPIEKEVLLLVFKYCDYYNHCLEEGTVPDNNINIYEDISMIDFIQLMRAADFLDIQPLLILCSNKITMLIHNMPTQLYNELFS